ncbi:MAG: phosphoenolpyruvate--protein phosphotransferase [Alphaproteobacteria bacterium]
MVIVSSLYDTFKWEGISLVGGYAKGKAFVLKPISDYELEKTDTPLLEQKKFRKAIQSLEKSFSKALKNKISEEQKSLLEISKMLLLDRGWNRQIEEKISTGLTAQTAVCCVTEEITRRMNELEDVYLRERMNDFQDLASRLLHYLDDNETEKLSNGVILVAKNLGPAQLMDYDLSQVKGIVLAEGSSTMHMAIVARAYGIPLLGGVSEIWKKVKTGNFVALDAVKGLFYKNPSDEIMNELSAAEKQATQQTLLALKDKNKPSFTKDGAKIELGVNLGLADDILLANTPFFDKVGLYRTELPFMLAKELPDCETQTNLYKKVLAGVKGKPVIFRTLDIGSDKVLPYTRPQQEENPAMGWRSTRMTLDRRALLRVQLKALIRATEGETLYVMFPMIGEISEFLMAKQTLDFELALAKSAKRPVPKHVFVGTMLEIPSLFFYLKNNIQLFDFISIGTNDLKQFFFACDRGNRSLMGRYDNLSPAFLMFLKEIQQLCSKAHIPCSVCGEMAGNTLEAMVLIALGFDSLSMNPHSLLKIKHALRRLDKKDFASYLNRLLESQNTSLRSAVISYLRDHKIEEG